VNEKTVERILQEVRSGAMSVEAAAKRFKTLPIEDLEFATLDTHRGLRRGFPEVIYGQGKTADQIKAIIKAMLSRKENCLITRVDEAKGKALKKIYRSADYDAVSKTFFVKSHPGTILVVCAGTSDVPVAEEAAKVAAYMGNRVERLYDVGVAGIHRLLMRNDELRKANVLVVVAGMEGALPSVVAGLVDRPVIAVPTSVGYGANLGGITTLMAMLNSCASGVSVVNIDNGFGAAYVASLINRE
jgi:NCAIR mutase (PurE)-related protein